MITPILSLQPTRLKNFVKKVPTRHGETLVY